MSSLPQVAAHMSSVIPDAVSMVSGLNPGTARARLTSMVSPSRIACFKAAERDKHQNFVGRAKSWFLGLNLFSLKYSSSSFIIHFNLSHPWLSLYFILFFSRTSLKNPTRVSHHNDQNINLLPDPYGQSKTIHATPNYTVYMGQFPAPPHQVKCKLVIEAEGTNMP